MSRVFASVAYLYYTEFVKIGEAGEAGPGQCWKHRGVDTSTFQTLPSININVFKFLNIRAHTQVRW